MSKLSNEDLGMLFDILLVRFDYYKAIDIAKLDKWHGYKPTSKNDSMSIIGELLRDFNTQDFNTQDYIGHNYCATAGYCIGMINGHLYILFDSINDEIQHINEIINKEVYCSIHITKTLRLLKIYEIMDKNVI